MKKIGLLSDTHGYLNPRLEIFFSKCNEIWHAGDIGNLQTAEKLESINPLKAVYGNIDGTEIRSIYPEKLRFTCEGMEILIIHIGGYPGNYDRRIGPELKQNPPDLFISGHSHILKVMNDNSLNLLHINPGAAGKNGFHKVQTAVRFTLNNKRISDLEVWELPR